ncbi:MAG: class IV adenylate cyclase [Anaerolineales bacterium]
MEIEAKFQLPTHYSIRRRIIESGGHPLTGRFLERNTRLDTPDGRLAADQILLRLRQGQQDTLTVKKGTATYEARYEYEIEIDDYPTTLELLGVLGYQKTVVYEKYREVFNLRDLSLMLDEVPFGFFIEIEGPDLETIQHLAEELGLEWSRRVRRSYVAIFERLRNELGFEFEDATFSNFALIPPITPEILEKVIA